MADIIETIFGIITTFPFNVIIVVAIVAYIAYIIYNRRKKEPEEFQIEDFRESVFLATEKLLDTFGVNIKASLTRGIEPMGKVSKFYHFKGKIQMEDMPDVKTDDKKKKLKDAEDVNLWIFRIGEKSFIQRIFGGGTFDYVIVEDTFMEPYDGSRKHWGIKEDASFSPYGNVFIASKKGEAFVNDISYRRSIEEVRTLMQNFPRKVAYLELRQAKTLERIEAGLEKKNAGYDSYKKSVLASGKDLEDTEEDDA
jgi:hypothetical protein